MNKQPNEQDNLYILNLIITFFLIMLPFILITYRQYIWACLYVITVSLRIIWVNAPKVIKKFKIFYTDNKSNNCLKSYHITDDNKIIDLNKRIDTFSFLNDVTSSSMFILVANYMALYFLFLLLFGSSSILNMIFTIALIIILIVGYSGMFITVIYKYTTLTYVSIPFISFFLYIIVSNIITFTVPDFANFIIYLGITLLLYFLLSHFLPAHIIRNLTGRTVLISSSLTICVALISQIISFYFSTFFRDGNYLLTLEQVESATDVSDSLKTLVLDNPELIRVINYFSENVASNQLTSIVGITTSAITLSYIIGGILVNRKHKKYSLKAKTIYRDLIMNTLEIDYFHLIQCAYYGGEKYENLMLNNEQMRKCILDNECHLSIPVITRKRKFKNWLKRNFAPYQFYSDVRDTLES